MAWAQHSIKRKMDLSMESIWRTSIKCIPVNALWSKRSVQHLHLDSQEQQRTGKLVTKNNTGTGAEVWAEQADEMTGHGDQGVKVPSQKVVESSWPISSTASLGFYIPSQQQSHIHIYTPVIGNICSHNYTHSWSPSHKPNLQRHHIQSHNFQKSLEGGGRDQPEQ